MKTNVYDAICENIKPDIFKRGVWYEWAKVYKG